ncbi:MAG TPA: hypothetical protein VMH20_14370 [Verrucomicrobiae bacterium]|nr:hypothetical protein [Verrucomicrobiae bacterium]
MNSKADYQVQVDKILASRSLHSSDSLRKLLRYLADHSLKNSGAAPKEYQIATEVFGRRGDFDPHLDSMVRVQVARLRAKLAEYYASEGVADMVEVGLPKGTYALTYHERARTPQPEPVAVPVAAPPQVVAPKSLSVRWVTALVLLSVLLAGSLTVAIDRLILRERAEAHSAETTAVDGPIPPPIRTFWDGFLAGHEQPWVVFSNAHFVGRPDSGMRYYDPKRDSKALTLDHYTGVGEVLAVHALDGVFAELHQQLRVKRGSLFSLDDAKNTDLIFIGSPSENLTLLEIPTTKQFVFQEKHCCSREGDVEIINVHPADGEMKEYLASPSNQVLTEDYAVIALVSGLDASHSVLILAGTTTIGTQAAVEYVCQQNSVEALLHGLGVSKSSDLKPFEAVIHVKVVRGVPVNSELVALHKEPT